MLTRQVRSEPSRHGGSISSQPREIGPFTRKGPFHTIERDLFGRHPRFRGVER